VIKRYPHELSGGMRQRAMIAMALSCTPSVLFADEPTTALDVTTEAQILDLMHEIQQQINSTIVFITHNLGVVAQMCDTVAVMYLAAWSSSPRWMTSSTTPSTPTPWRCFPPSRTPAVTRKTACNPSAAWSPIPIPHQGLPVPPALQLLQT